MAAVEAKHPYCTFVTQPLRLRPGFACGVKAVLTERKNCAKPTSELTEVS